MTETPILNSSELKSFVKQNPQQSVRAYKRRWCILIIYVLYAAANAFQWMEYAIITSIVTKYYNVSSLAVDWTSIIYMAIYPFIVIPVSYLIDKKGLRIAALVGGIATALAGVIKLFSIRQDMFYMVLIGQAIGSTAQVFVLPLPTKIAAVWFKPNEVSTACSIAVFGTQLGLALGFQIPTILVKNDPSGVVIASGLRVLSWALVVYMLPVVTAIIFCFPRQPPLPPSILQIEERKRSPPTFMQFLKAVKKLFRKNGFFKHSIGYGIIIGVLAGISTFLNQFILYYFPNCEEDAGRMGFLTICIGMVGSIMFGVYLDKTHRYKETSLFIYYMSTVSVIGFMLSLYWKNKVFSYITCSLIGLFTNSYMVVGFEFAIELTFPADESTATGIMNGMTQGFGVIITLALGKLNQYYGPFYSLLSQAILLFIGAVLTQMVPNQKFRQKAYLESRKEEELLTVSA